MENRIRRSRSQENGSRKSAFLGIAPEFRFNLNFMRAMNIKEMDKKGEPEV